MKEKFNSDGNRLTSEIIFHKDGWGGTLVCVSGGDEYNTTGFLTKIAKSICYYTSQKTYTSEESILNCETSIWRGQEKDYWTQFDRERTRLFIHASDNISFNIPDLPIIIRYKTVKDVYLNLLRGGFNIIYEPSDYVLSNNIKNKIYKRFKIESSGWLDKEKIDPEVWWFEFMDWLTYYKISDEHISIFINNSPILMPKNPSNTRWYLNLWFKDTLRNIRRKNISVYHTCKTYNDIDQRLKPTIGYHVFMRGAELPDYSLIHKNTSLKKLSDGEYYIERDAYGLGKIDGIKPFENKVIAERLV